MFRNRFMTCALFALLPLGLSGCFENSDSDLLANASTEEDVDDGGGTGEDTSTAEPDIDEPGDPDVTDGPVESLSSRLKMKSGAVLATELSNALGIERNDVCRELGTYSCADEIHRIALGGVEPYVQAIPNPLPIAPVTAPIAVDRIALSACVKRAEIDFGAPSEGLFSPVVVAQGRPDDAAMESVVAGLTRGLMLREPTAAELEEFIAFYDEVTAEGSDDPNRDWAVLTCFALASHIEVLFF